MNGRSFVDTNIFVYAVSDEADPRSHIAVRLIENLLRRQNSAISYQVVQEFLNVALTKFRTRLTPDHARRYLTIVFQRLHIVHSSLGLYNGAIDVRARYQLSWYDSLIVAAALEAKCSVLYTEDLQHGMTFDGLRVENPFLNA